MREPPVERCRGRQNASALPAAQPPVGREQLAGDIAREQPTCTAIPAGVDNGGVDLRRHPCQHALQPEPNFAAVVVRHARDPILAGEALDDQPPAVGQHNSLQASSRLAGMHERLSPVDLPDGAHRVGGNITEWVTPCGRAQYAWCRTIRPPTVWMKWRWREAVPAA